MIYLKQSTAGTIPLGYFLDSTNGDTEETALTIGTADVLMLKAHATSFVNPAGTPTHISNGVYWLPLTTGETDTVGQMTIFCHPSGALATKTEITILPGTVYDSLIGGSDNLQVDAVQVSGDSTAADNLELFFDGTGYNASNSTVGTTTTVTNDVGITATAVDNVWDEVITGAAHNVNNSAAKFLRESAEGIGITGTAQAGGASSITLAAAASGTNDIYNFERIFLIEGTGAGQSRLITAYNGTSKVATVNRAWTTQPSTDTVYSIVGADADMAAISNDTTAADNLEAAFDGTGSTMTLSRLDINGQVTVDAAVNNGGALEITNTGTTNGRGVEINGDDAGLWVGASGVGSDGIYVEGLGNGIEIYSALGRGAYIHGDNGDGMTIEAGSGGSGDGLNAIGDTAGGGVDIRGDITGNITGNLTGNINTAAGTLQTLDALDTAQDSQHSTTQAAITALNDIAVADILTTQMTESYAADGAAPTLAQSLMMIQQMLGDFAISGTTLTVKKVDGSTTAATFTLNDATNPTSLTRAT